MHAVGKLRLHVGAHGVLVGVAAVHAHVVHGVLGPSRRGRTDHLTLLTLRRGHHAVRRCPRRFLGCVQVCLFLRFPYVLLVSYPLVAEPIRHLRDGDAALPGEFLLGLLRRVRVAKVRVEILVQDLRRLLAEVASLSPCVEEPGPEDHDGLAGALLELHLDGVELLVDYLHHALDLLGRDRPRPTLLPQKVHHVRRELVARLLVLLQLLVVDLPDLCELGPVVGVLDGVLGLAPGGRRRRVGRRPGAAALLGTRHTLGDQHVVQPHQLRVRGLLFLRVP
uniref:Uncharacterized protein n=1 Tax=Ixodes ricinus TaxID=34613 RepID=A0A6B0V6Z8_IXORI